MGHQEKRENKIESTPTKSKNSSVSTEVESDNEKSQNDSNSQNNSFQENQNNQDKVPSESKKPKKSHESDEKTEELTNHIELEILVRTGTLTEKPAGSSKKEEQDKNEADFQKNC